ncbi:beta-ketoacyl synthase N-terminal-like domain-containing protein [Actinomadura kijaniata]|uniref:thiolase family protein n=1 Tax=Actinomadura kijaniata TaxID=46161 RepID=UPI0008307A29|nr:beta-ketoacyl synthase N-terminal-like domain-containing protein [Actinomadura kijaniata]
MSNRTFVVGVGMTKFEKPGGREWDYPDMARESGTKALADAGLSYDAIQQAYVGYVYGESTSGQRAVYELGITGIPVVNVNNNCSTGSTALYLARQAVKHGVVDCALALGFEKMQKGSLGSTYEDREQPMLNH